MPEIPEPGAGETCDTAGVLGPAVHVVAALQVVDALKILSGRPELVLPVLTIIDVWETSLRTLDLSSLHQKSNCPACRGGERLWLHGESGSRSVILCGRNAVQISPTQIVSLELDQVAARLQQAGTVQRNPFLLKFRPQAEPGMELTLFPDGRAIIQGTEETSTARTLYARYVSN